MEQLASAPPPDGSFGALRQAFRHWAGLSREQLAARAEPSERTLRNLEAGRLTVALLTGGAQNASALAIDHLPDRQSRRARPGDPLRTAGRSPVPRSAARHAQMNGPPGRSPRRVAPWPKG